MKTFVLTLALALFAAGPAFAISQQDKMKSCNADATKKELKGDERKKFMSECLSAEGGAQGECPPSRSA